MADNKDKKVLNVPAIRFPEFTGEWKIVKVGTITTKVGSGVTPRGGETIYRSQGHPFVRSQNVGWGRLLLNDIAYIDEETHKKQLNTALEQNDVLLNITGASIGRCAIVNEMIVNGNVNQHVCIIRSNGAVDSEFLCNYLLSNYGQKQIDSFQAGGNRQGLNFEQIKSIRISIPTLDEQKHIAKLLCAINQRIETQNKIIEDLKKLRSAIAEALFCTPKESMPAKRLSPYSKEWKLVKLSDICQRIQTKNKGRQCRQVLTIAAQYGLVNQEDFFNKTVASENLEGYYLLQKGDFAYNKSYSGDYTWGAIKRLERYDKGVLSPLYICFRPDSSKVDADFLAHYFESKKWYKGVADIAGEGARNHGLLNISVIDFFNTTHRIPNIDEQKRIAKILNSLSLKLSCEQRIMQSLVMQRNYLLRNMFI